MAGNVLAEAIAAILVHQTLVVPMVIVIIIIILLILILILILARPISASAARPVQLITNVRVDKFVSRPVSRIAIVVMVLLVEMDFVLMQFV